MILSKTYEYPKHYSFITSLGGGNLWANFTKAEIKSVYKLTKLIKSDDFDIYEPEMPSSSKLGYCNSYKDILRYYKKME